MGEEKEANLPCTLLSPMADNSAAVAGYIHQFELFPLNSYAHSSCPYLAYDSY